MVWMAMGKWRLECQYYDFCGLVRQGVWTLMLVAKGGWGDCYVGGVGRRGL